MGGGGGGGPAGGGDGSVGTGILRRGWPTSHCIPAAPQASGGGGGGSGMVGAAETGGGAEATGAAGGAAAQAPTPKIIRKVSCFTPSSPNRAVRPAASS